MKIDKLDSNPFSPGDIITAISNKTAKSRRGTAMIANVPHTRANCRSLYSQRNIVVRRADAAAYGVRTMGIKTI